MLDISQLQSTTAIKVEASNRIFSELGNNTYDYKDLLSELIDNSITARKDGKALQVKINVIVDQSNSPIEFVISDNGNRVILFHQLSELEIIQAQHPDYNDVRGEIDLKKGFYTAITKNSVIHDQHFKECLEKIIKILNGEQPGPQNRTEDYLNRKTYPEEIPESLLRDRLKEWLSNNPLQKRKNVSTEYSVEGIEGFIDIKADEEAWEIKVDQASALDVYQLFMYMDVGNIKKGFLVANEFSTGATVAAKFIKDNHDTEITLAPRSQFPINHPPSSQEREEYY